MRVSEARDSAANILKLKLGRIDCYINDRYAIAWTTRQLEADGRLTDAALRTEVVEAAVIAVKRGYLGYTSRDQGRFPFKADFVRQFDTAIDDLKRSGQLDHIVRSHLQQTLK
ncbi:transporter substrate-binding domain-containing protein [Duganella sp. Leaf126]|uniref:transporter substrate-binding domain-containing protein n=1 Tax=Duganella sp. Leaf126 TaxID=1736266 RepID=UPI000A44C26C